MRSSVLATSCGMSTNTWMIAGFGTSQACTYLLFVRWSWRCSAGNQARPPEPSLRQDDKLGTRISQVAQFLAETGCGPGAPRPVLCRELAQHVMQDAAVLEIFELVERIDTADQGHVLLRAVPVGDLRLELLPRPQRVGETVDRHLLVAFQAKRRPRRAFLEGAGQHAHADEVGAMDALEALRDDRAYAEKPRAFRRPVTRRAVAVFGPGD